MPETKLQLGSGQIVAIPPRLSAKLENEAVWKYRVVTQTATRDQGEGKRSLYAVESATTALKLASQAIQQEAADEAVLYLGLYVEKEVASLAADGQAAEGLQLLVESICFSHRILANFQPNLTSALIQQLARHTEEAIRLSTNFGSVATLHAGLDDMREILSVAATVWDPVLEPWLNNLKAFLPAVAEVAVEMNSKQRRHVNELTKALLHLKRQIDSAANSSAPAVRPRLRLLRNLADVWLQMVQQELLLSATAEYSAVGLDSDSVRQQVQHLLADVEGRLRLVVAEKYEAQFGVSWLQHIEAKHKGMYRRWQRNQQKDDAGFKAYEQAEVNVLSYSSFNDLGELISAQWHLFNDIFDFGYGKRNKSVLVDKFTHIVKVRNPLAHHREIPENELLRAKVLCTDILLVLDQAGAGLEQ